MAEQEVGMYYCPDEENLKYMEDLGLSYKEIAKHFLKPQTEFTIKYYFKRFNIHHKTKKERIKELLEIDPFRSTNSVAIKLGVSARLVNMVKAEMPKKTRIRCSYVGENKDKFVCIISGHSNYAPRGYDIVCASVSSIAQFVVNTIQEWKKVECKIQNGYMCFSYKVDTDYEYYITSSLVKHFIELSNQFPDNVSVTV